MLNLRKDSYMIGKSGCKSNKEKDWSQVSSSSASSGMIRVIHIFTPKIIQTDVANFRELVQRLTGNTKRLRSSNKSKRSPPRAQQILSKYSNATRIFASSSRVEYSIPRSPDSYLSPPYILDFHKQEEDVKPRITQSSCIDFSCSSSDQSCCSPFPFAEVTSPHFHGQFSQSELNSINVDCNYDQCGIPNSALRSNRNQEQQQQEKKKVQTFAPIMGDPFQSLSGYREKLPPPPQKSSTTAFPLFEERSHLMLANRFSDMDNTLTGLVTPGPLQGIPMALAPHVNNSSDFTFQSSLLNNSNGLCRFSVQSPLRGGIRQMFENF
ncbi:unnamed protein product [Calypogeia fissa]